MTTQTKFTFLAKNLAKALVYALVIFVAYYLFKEYIITEHQEIWLKQFYSKPLIIYLIYIFSEVFFGLFPPEFFMLWAYHGGGFWYYFSNLLFFAGISYVAGMLSFAIGRYLRRTLYFRYVSRRFFKTYWPMFRKYGSALIIAAALTPLPWALISMLVGTTQYPFKRYLLFAISRLIRFAVYGIIVFQSHQL